MLQQSVIIPMPKLHTAEYAACDAPVVILGRDKAVGVEVVDHGLAVHSIAL